MMQYLEAASDCCCIRILFLPIMGIMYGQQRVNNRIRHVVKELQPNLSQRTKDLKIRKMELELDHLELEGKCCVCRRNGAKVLGRQRHDGGLTKIDEEDMAELANTFGTPCRGYLCPTCIDVAVRIRVRRALGKSQATSGEPKERLPEWVLASLKDRQCDGCRGTPITHFYAGAEAAELLCRVCICQRRKRKLRFPLGKPLPLRVRVEIQMLCNKARPVAERIDPTHRQSLDLFAGQQSDLFRTAENQPLVASAEEENDLALHMRRNCGVDDSTKFSDADFGAALLTETRDARSRLQTTQRNLFVGRRVQSDATSLFDVYWGPGAPGSPAPPRQQRSSEPAKATEP